MSSRGDKNLIYLLRSYGKNGIILLDSSSVKWCRKTPDSEQLMTNISSTREIDIRLTRDRSFLSYLIYFIGLGGLTHASIGLNRKDEFFYSFNTKGFRKEYLHPRKKRLLNTATYRIRVSEESYQILKDTLVQMYEKREEYGYSGFGVALCFSRLPFRIRFKNRYFCSQFVAKTLTESGCVRIVKKPEHCFPKRIAKELSKSSQLVDVTYTTELVPIPKLLLSKIQTGTDMVRRGTQVVIRGTIRYTVPFFTKATYFSLLRRMRLLFAFRRYAKKLKKMCVYIMYEQYKEIFSRKGEKKDGQ